MITTNGIYDSTSHSSTKIYPFTSPLSYRKLRKFTFCRRLNDRNNSRHNRKVQRLASIGMRNGGITSVRVLKVIPVLC